MRILIISDIHANLTALEAVLADAGEIDAVWCLGDLVGYGPDPNQCIERVAQLPQLICLIGNHDAAALGQINLEAFNREARQSIRWLMSNLSADNKDFLQALPEKVCLDEITLSHGSPRNPVWEYVLDTSTATANFAHFETPYCFVGHTHLPALCTSNNGSQPADLTLIRSDADITLTPRTIINPGSVGQPRDHDPRAAYALYHPDENIWQPRRVDYDVNAVRDRIYEAGLPRRHAVRLSQGW